MTVPLYKTIVEQVFSVIVSKDRMLRLVHVIAFLKNLIIHKYTLL